ncbi:MAG: hypothetical protein QM597_08785 [Aeromicrobium sp.]|uniref:hypothetical protein n=1 Tax=Aeromicrobium sp. TaxID=1871063 RepID=UPI0039E310B8
MRRLRFASAVLLPLALVLAGCGDDDTTADSPDPSDSVSQADEAPTEAPEACDVLSADDASAAAGFTVTAESGPLGACEYDQEDPTATSFSLDLMVQSDLGGSFDDYLAAMQAPLEVEDESTPDLGEGARILTGTASGFSMTTGAAYEDGVLYTVTVTPGSDLDSAGELALTEALLRAALDAA